MKDNNKWILAGIVCVIAIMSPYIINWDNSHITIHDYLDGIYVLPQVIQQQGAIFDFDSNIHLMNGIKRASFPMTYPWEIKPLISYLLPGYGGVLLNYLLVRLLAFIGMWLLLVNYVTKHKIVAFAVSLLFSFIPFYAEFGISSAGIPLLAYALLNLKDANKLSLSYFFVVLFALYSSFALSGLFVCFLLFVWIIVLWYEKRKLNKYLAISLIVLTLIYISTNWALILDFFVGVDFVSHRVEWDLVYTVSDVLHDLVFDELIISQYHAGAFVALPIVLVFFLIYALYRKDDKTLAIYAFLYVMLSLLIVLGTSAKMLPLSFFKSFQLDRFSFMYAAMCFILLAKACDVLYSQHKKLIVMASFVISVVCIGVVHKEYIKNVIECLDLNIKFNSPSYAQFYDEELFVKIAKDIHVAQDYSVKVVSLGMFPSIPSYNGFWSLDGYMSSYSLEYKHEFRKVIINELDKDNVLKSYFDNWGSRCYIFSSELKERGNQYLCSTKDDISVNHLDINTKILKELGCEYIFSAVDIKNYKDLNLVYVNNYTTNESYWNVRVYKLN